MSYSYNNAAFEIELSAGFVIATLVVNNINERDKAAIITAGKTKTICNIFLYYSSVNAFALLQYAVYFNNKMQYCYNKIGIIFVLVVLDRLINPLYLLYSLK